MLLCRPRSPGSIIHPPTPTHSLIAHLSLPLSPSQDPYAVSKPSIAEATGFTRRPLLHSTDELTGGFVYVEPPNPQPPAVRDVQVVGNKLPTGFTINNVDMAAEPVPAAAMDVDWA